MAYVDQQDPNQQQQPGAAPQAPMTSSGTSASSAPGSAPVAQGQGVAAQPNASKQPAVQDLGAYLRANAPQVQQMGQNVANQITQTGQQAQGQADQASKAFNDAVQGGKVDLNQGLIDNAATNTASFASDPNNVASFQKELNAKYSGPSDFTQQFGYNDANQAIQNAVQTAKSVSNPGGLENLVAKDEVNPTQGVRTLDSMLLQQDPTAQQTVQAAAKPYLGLNDYLSNLTATNNAAAQKAQTDTANTAQTVHDKFLGANGVVPTWQQGLQAKQQQAEQQRTAYNTQLANELTQGQGADAALKAYMGETGFKPDNPFSDLLRLTPAGTPATLENTASAQDFGTEQALTSLLGQPITTLNPALQSDAGSYKAPSGAVPNIKDLAVQAARNAAAQNALPNSTWDPQAFRDYQTSGRSTRDYSSLWNLFNYLSQINPNIVAEGKPGTGTWGTTIKE